jgi:hypothetical protein
MAALDRLIPQPQLTEIDSIDVAAPAPRVWERVRHYALGHTRLVRALFALRTLSESTARGGMGASIRIDDLQSSPEHPGFQLLVDDPPNEFAVGAIGKVWRLDIPFVHVRSPEEFEAWMKPDFAKVAWAIRVTPNGEHHARIDVEVRVLATDEHAWRKFSWYFRVIGPFSRLIRRLLLKRLVRDTALGDCAVA